MLVKYRVLAGKILFKLVSVIGTDNDEVELWKNLQERIVESSSGIVVSAPSEVLFLFLDYYGIALSRSESKYEQRQT